MSLMTVLQEFSARPPGTDAYKELKVACLGLCKTDPDNAAAYFLLFGFARSYVLLFEEEAVPPELADRAKRQLVGYVETLARGITDGTAEAKLAALNAVILDYLQSDRIF